MSTSPPVFHHAPRPISIAEFRDAVEATCRPRFPAVRFARTQRIALAVSGGVDSMAMAFLFASLLKSSRGMKVADNPATSALGIVIDHELREGSGREASQVVGELKRMGLRAIKKPLRWRDLKGDATHPSQLTNAEGLARTMRYRALGNTCKFLQSASLFFAHHRDDQYETVLMRLLAGHGYRGLQGIREANAIPECYDLHGVYKSGLLDDQMQQYPFLSFKPPNREMRRLRDILRHEERAESWAQLSEHLGPSYAPRFPGHIERQFSPDVPYLTPLNSEDGGVTIYRPLLGFDKDRLRATCEANNVMWFEDITNEDRTMTPRNAIRYTVRNHNLPRALQKPAILALSERARQRTRLEESEARRWLLREAVIRDFDPNVGTLLVDLPASGVNYCGWTRRTADARDRARIPHRRLLSAIAVRKLIEFVTPEHHLPAVSGLGKVVQKLFPELWPNEPVVEAKAFSIAGVVFSPVHDDSVGSAKWFLARAPYPAHFPLPERKLAGHHSYRRPTPEEGEDLVRRFTHWRSWKTAKMWDGRFWVLISTCVAARFHIHPFMAEHAKPFRRALPAKSRARLEQVLKYYAPGKVRYSLPGLYSVETSVEADGETKQRMTLLALPSLGISVPGLERWVKYEARFKNVDVALLGLQRRRGKLPPPLFGYKPACSASRRRRRRRRRRVGEAGGTGALR